jgi:hypothetical protein
MCQKVVEHGGLKLVSGNAASGGDGWKSAFFCTRTSLGSFRVKIPGVPVPAVKKS